MGSGSEFILTILDVMHNKKVAIYFKKVKYRSKIKIFTKIRENSLDNNKQVSYSYYINKKGEINEYK